jgi:hypothetical protein
MKNVGHDNLTPSSPQVVSEDPSEKGQERFPMKAVGDDEEERSRFAGMDGEKASISKTQHVHIASDIL